MGGRGGASGLSGEITGISVTMNGETTRYYFTKRSGQNFYQRGVGGTPEPTPMNMTANEFRNRVESSGAKVKNISASEMAKEEINYKADRKATNEFLNREDFNRTMAKGSRESRASNRANRRGGRR